ncbi:hypothetical protein SBA6_840006 [Candidatus Sulfopaludibacter sp. SbA6]|nr:hypothetical protein SBA6_840006 [Candidatus Sulfopaludibacter sp. SbA6]
MSRDGLLPVAGGGRPSAAACRRLAGGPTSAMSMRTPPAMAVRSPIRATATTLLLDAAVPNDRHISQLLIS